MADQTTKTTDTAAASANGKTATAVPASGTPAGTDWESDANPYKKRFAGEQRAKAQLQSRVSQLEQSVTANKEMLDTLKRLEGRVNSVEELAAELHDSRTQTDDLGDDEDTNRPSSRRVDQVRQRRVQESHVERVKRVYNLIQNGWVEGMDPNDPRLARVRALYQGAASDVSRADDLLEAGEIFMTVANEARAAAATPAAKAGAGDTGKGTKASKPEPETEATDSDDTETDDAEPEEEESPRERVAKSGVTAGQGAEGRAPDPSDRSKLKPYQLFERSHRGQGYVPPVR